MNDIIILSAVMFFCIVLLIILILNINGKIKSVKKTLSHQYALMLKMQSILKSKHATNIVMENAEMIYQDLLQNLIPVMAAIDVMPRNSSEHSLWRAVGAILDEYSKNPFVLEKLRREIKLNSEISRAIDSYLNRADKFLRHIMTTEPNGILAASFTDGLLGQSLSFFAQAKQLAAKE